jgi:hypothetical protein
MKDSQDSKANKCHCCTSENTADECILATAKTVIDGKEYSACCANITKTSEEKNKKSDQKSTNIQK